MPIIRLPESLASRIAAGEVVDRPASVVKELVENSLDAGAKEISVWVEGNGVSLIRVSDDGAGIAPIDLPLAVERHSTSKLKSEADLFRIATLGFRGEALPSIASVAKLEIISRVPEENVGYRLRVEGGKKGDAVVAGCPAGTTVEVRDLFFNTPARRKFLKSPVTEWGHVSEVLNRLSLSFGQVHFRLYREDKIVSDYVSVPHLQDRLQQVLGSQIAAAMVPFFADRGSIRISGFVSAAPSSFPSSRYLMIYVNRRFVRDRVISHAILQGYETLLMKGRYPAVVLYLEIPVEDVDVNVHPAKYEVRFRRQSDIHDAVVEAVREALKGEAKGQPSHRWLESSEPILEVREAPLPYSPPFPARVRHLEPFDAAKSDTVATGSSPKFYSSLDILGQILGCYLVCVSHRGMVLIDQHAAHERIAFERMRSELERGEIQRQNLLLAQILECSVGEAALLEQNLGVLDSLGFSVEAFGASSFAIQAVPALLPPGDYRQAVRGMIAQLAEVGKSSELKLSLEERLMTIACHSVVRANRKLERDEIRALLRELDQIDFATQCPHGRPVLIELTQDQLERMFKRA